MAKKTITQPKNKKPELFYVGVRNSIDVRKNILESTKEFVQVLQMYESYMKLRGEISEKVEKLETDIKKIKNLNLKLKRMLPETGLRAGFAKQMPRKKVQAPAKEAEKEEKKKPKKSSSEIDQLEDELNIIESRLNKLQ